MMNYQVTVAMPVYNVGPEIERAIIAALDQTFESIEFLIVDDKGGDNSIEIARQIIEKHPRGSHVRIIDQGVNQGTGAARNAAITQAQGKYLYLMDSDDVIVPDCIEMLYNEIERNPVDMVASSFRKVSPDGKQEILCRQFPDMTVKEKYAFAKYRKGCEKNFYVMTWNKLYNTAFLRDNNILCIPHHLNEDVWFTFQLHYNVNAFTLLSRVTYDWYMRANSTTHTVVNKGLGEAKVKSFLEILAYKKRAIAENPKAGSCPYIIDDIVEFTMQLSEGILRSQMSWETKQELIKQVTNIDSIAHKKADSLGRQLIFSMMKHRNRTMLLGYLFCIRYGRGVASALKSPLHMIRKKLG